MKVALALAALVVIAGASLVTYSRLGAFVFARGSDSTLLVSRPSPWLIAITSGALFLFSSFLIWGGRRDWIELTALFVLLSIWLASGRVVGIFPDGRLVAGWFFIPSTVVDFHHQGEDEETHLSHTKVVASSGFVLNICSHGKAAKVFVGPALKGPVLRLLKARGFDVSS